MGATPDHPPSLSSHHFCLSSPLRVPSVLHRQASPTLATCRFECTGIGRFYLVANPWRGYGHGNTWFSSLANIKASHWTIFMCWSPLQCEAPAKPINFHVFYKKNCLVWPHSIPCLRAESFFCFSVHPHLTDRYRSSSHLASKNRSLQPKLPFLSPSWEIHVHVSCLSSGSLQWVTLHVYSNTHTEAWTSPNMKGHVGIFTAISPSLACESNVYKTLSEKRE